MAISEWAQEFEEKILKGLRKDPYILADTRLQHVSLYDHLSLTAGIAVALLKELQGRGRKTEEICGTSLSENDLLTLTCLCGWMHDIGKAYLGETEYRRHVQRGAEWAREWLEQRKVSEPLRFVIMGAISRHHLRDGPQTLLEKVICLADSYASAGDRPELARAETEEQLLQSAERTLKLERELFGDEKPVCLLLGDVDSVKEFVYEGRGLPEIRGASQTLAEVEQEIGKRFRKKLCEDSLVYCGGGSFLAIVPTSEAGEWKKEIELLYLERTKLATITIVLSSPLGYIDFGRGVPPYGSSSVAGLKGKGVAEDLLFSHFEAISEERAERKNFGELVARLSADLQRAKQEKIITPFFPTLPVHQRCQSCGKRPAGKLDVEEFLCDPCFQKRKEGRKGRSTFMEKVACWIEKQFGWKVTDKPARDLDDLAGAEGRVAFIYADGNDVGDLLQRAKTPAQYRHISDALNTVVEEVLFKALVETFEKRELCERQRLPLELIVVGGDDLTVIVPARYGWRLTVKLLRGFEEHQQVKRIREETERKLTISAGLVIADVKYPVGFMQRLAEGLLKKAKSIVREMEEKESTLCHLWLRSPIASEDPDMIMETLYHRKDGGERWLTARPYTLKQVEELERIALKLSFLPSHQRRILAEALEKGVHVSLNVALYQAGRREKRECKELLEFFRKLGDLVSGEEDREKFFFWRKKEGRWQTALLDALELLELGGERK